MTKRAVAQLLIVLVVGVLAAIVVAALASGLVSTRLARPQAREPSSALTRRC